MIDRLLYIGTTHKTAAVSVREALAAGPDRVPSALSRLRRDVEECVVLSTCGRFELYMVLPPERHHDWPAILASFLHQPASVLKELLHTRSGRDAALHAVRVAAGLESRVLGEDQILSQTRNAFSLACELRACGPMLSALFRAAIHAGKRVRAETAINRHGGSLARMVIHEISRHSSVPDAIQRRIVIVGSGAMAHEVAAQLARRGAGRRHFVSRHRDRATALADRYSGMGHTLDELSILMRRADVVIACAAASRPLIVPQMFQGCSPREHLLLLIDLGVPRNIDAACGNVAGVRLIGLDALQSRQAVHSDAIDSAERIIDEELSRFDAWLRGRAAAPAITTLLRFAEQADPCRRRALRRTLHARIIRLKQEAVA